MSSNNNLPKELVDDLSALKSLDDSSTALFNKKQRIDSPSPSKTKASSSSSSYSLTSLWNAIGYGVQEGNTSTSSSTKPTATPTTLTAMAVTTNSVSSTPTTTQPKPPSLMRFMREQSPDALEVSCESLQRRAISNDDDDDDDDDVGDEDAYLAQRFEQIECIRLQNVDLSKQFLARFFSLSRSLSLVDCNIASLSASLSTEDAATAATAKFNRLEYLNLSHNPIVSLEPCLFLSTASAATLTTLDVGHCHRLARLDSSLPPLLYNLTQLDLSHCALKTLPQTMFESMSRLSVLRIDHNQLVSLPLRGLSSLQQLSTLSLASNALTSLPYEALVECKMYLKCEQDLDWSHNKLARVPEELLASFRLLRSANLESNRITQFPAHLNLMQKGSKVEVDGGDSMSTEAAVAVVAAPSPTAAAASSTSSSWFPSSFLVYSTATTDSQQSSVLLSSSTTIMQSAIESFAWPMLHSVNLSHNRIGSLSTCADDWRRYRSLRSLNLSHNWFTELPDAIALLHNLEYLCLASNASLIRLPVTLNELSRLQTLDVDGCTRLATVPFINDSTALPSLKKFIMPGVTFVRDAAEGSDDDEEVALVTAPDVLNFTKSRWRFLLKVLLRHARHPIALRLLGRLAQINIDLFMQFDGLRALHSLLVAQVKSANVVASADIDCLSSALNQIASQSSRIKRQVVLDIEEEGKEQEKKEREREKGVVGGDDLDVAVTHEAATTIVDDDVASMSANALDLIQLFFLLNNRNFLSLSTTAVLNLVYALGAFAMLVQRDATLSMDSQAAAEADANDDATGMDDWSRNRRLAYATKVCKAVVDLLPKILLFVVDCKRRQRGNANDVERIRHGAAMSRHVRGANALLRAPVVAKRLLAQLVFSAFREILSTREQRRLLSIVAGNVDPSEDSGEKNSECSNEDTDDSLNALDDSSSSTPYLCIETMNNFCFNGDVRRLLLASFDIVGLLRRLIDRVGDSSDTRLHQLQRSMCIMGTRPHVHEVVQPQQQQQQQQQQRSGRFIRILSLDGGGTRGLVAISMLRELEAKLNEQRGVLSRADPNYRRLHDFFDLICGTSTGGIIAVCLSILHMDIDDVERTYHALAAQVFSGASYRLLYKKSMHDTKRLDEAIKELVGEENNLIETSTRASVPAMFVVASNVSSYPAAPFIFRNYQYSSRQAEATARFDGACHHKVYEALRATSAAPLYLDTFRLGDQVFCDGGLMVNNPSALALHEANRIWGPGHVRLLVSVGNGRAPPRNFKATLHSMSRSISGTDVGSSSGGNNRGEQLSSASSSSSANARMMMDEEEDGNDGDDATTTTTTSTSTWSSMLWSRIKDSPYVQTLSAMYQSSTDAEAVHHTLREVLPESGIAYYRFNPTGKIYDAPLDTIDEQLLHEMQRGATEYIVSSKESQLKECIDEFFN